MIIEPPQQRVFKGNGVGSAPRLFIKRSNDSGDSGSSKLGLGRITKVLVFPRSYDENSDYKVIISEDKQSATIILQKPEKFQLARLAIAVD